MFGTGLSNRVAKLFPRSSPASPGNESEERSSIPGSVDEKHPSKVDSASASDSNHAEDPTLAPGELTYDEGTLVSQLPLAYRANVLLATAGGMGQHLGVFTCTMLMCVASSSAFHPANHGAP